MATMTPGHEQKMFGKKSPGRTPRQAFTFSSPNVKARVQEKEELSDLNDRLAAYIDRVRSLESQNAKLSMEITQSNETRDREVSSVKAMYETELATSRCLLDDTSKEKALLKLENNKLNGVLVDLRPKLEQSQAAYKQVRVGEINPFYSDIMVQNCNTFHRMGLGYAHERPLPSFPGLPRISCIK